jgi:hypothetical protein
MFNVMLYDEASSGKSTNPSFFLLLATMTKSYTDAISKYEYGNMLTGMLLERDY